MSERELRTINDILLMMRERNMPNVALRKTPEGWRSITAEQMYGMVATFAEVLRRKGIRKGDRIAIIGENRVEWAISDFACMGIGAVDVPIYPTLTAEQTEYLLKNSDARIAVVSTRALAEKVASCGYKVEHMLAMDDLEGEFGTEHLWRLLDTAGGGHEGALAESIEQVGPEDLATIIYTSGTTGTPKGVMLTHGNIACNLKWSVHDFGWGVGWRAVSFLPLSHITARHVDYLFFRYGVMIAYCPEINQLPHAFKETMPSIVVAVPRVYEKVRQEAMRQAGGGAKRAVFNWALRVGARHAPEILAGRAPRSRAWRLANRLVFSKIKAGFGGLAEQFISGGAPLGVNTGRWFASVGIRIMEGYGLTETSPVIAINTMDDYKLGTVGKPLPNLECRIAEDGELLVRGPSVFRGYWGNREETAQAFEGEWFKTGDIGDIDAEGFLTITDRKKDLLKTSGGKFIAPQPIENKLKMDTLVAQAAMIGDRRKFASVIIQPNFVALEDWARHNDIPYNSRKELVEYPDVKTLYQEIVGQVNAKLARFETMKRIVLVAEEFSIEGGEMTPSLKLKRRVVEKKYERQIEAIYSEAEGNGAAGKV
ncbi:MAG: long-chain fatty acid--CoA ligase [Acidobacteriaceae bacterium]